MNLVDIGAAKYASKFADKVENTLGYIAKSFHGRSHLRSLGNLVYQIIRPEDPIEVSQFKLLHKLMSVKCKNNLLGKKA